MAQNGTDWTPTDEQLKMAIILADPGETGTITEKCEKSGVPRRTFYNWMDDGEFVLFVNKLIEQYTDAELGNVWRSLVQQAVKGDIQAIKTFFEMKGKYVEKKKIDANINGKIDQTLTIVIGDENE